MNDDSDQIWSPISNTHQFSTDDEEKQGETPRTAKRIVTILAILDSRFDKYQSDKIWAEKQKKQSKTVDFSELTQMGIGITALGKVLGQNEGNDYPIKEPLVQNILNKMKKAKMVDVYEEKSHKYYYITEIGKKSIEKIRDEKNGLLGIIWDILLK